MATERKSLYLKRRPADLPGAEWPSEWEDQFPVAASTWNQGGDAIEVRTAVRNGRTYVLVSFAGEEVGAPAEAATLALRPNQFAWLVAALQDAPLACARFLDDPQDEREYAPDEPS